MHFVCLQLFDAHATEHGALLDRFDKASLIEFSALEQGGCQTRLCLGVNFKGEKQKGGAAIHKAASVIFSRISITFLKNASGTRISLESLQL